MEQITTSHLQEQNNFVGSLLSPQPIVIGLEGGPCGGKTTLTQRLELAAHAIGREIEVLPEAATMHLRELQATGTSLAELAVNNRPRFIEFEVAVMRTIVEQIRAAEVRYAETDSIILADRCDIGAYVSPEEHSYILSEVGLDSPPMLSMTDKLYYLPSVARENPKLYNEVRYTNATRYESAEEAIQTCATNLQSVSRHPELHVAWGGSFEHKIARLSDEILDHSSEYEVKLRPMAADNAHAMIRLAESDGRLLSNNTIEQSYHASEHGEVRLRKVTTHLGEIACYLTQKTGEGIKRKEVQRRITNDELDWLAQLPRRGRQLHKSRYELLHPSSGGEMQQWSLDYYNEPHTQLWQAEVGVRDEKELDAWVFHAFQLGGLSTRQLAMR